MLIYKYLHKVFKVDFPQFFHSNSNNIRFNCVIFVQQKTRKPKSERVGKI